MRKFRYQDVMVAAPARTDLTGAGAAAGQEKEPNNKEASKSGRLKCERKPIWGPVLELIASD